MLHSAIGTWYCYVGCSPYNNILMDIFIARNPGFHLFLPEIKKKRSWTLKLKLKGFKRPLKSHLSLWWFNRMTVLVLITLLKKDTFPSHNCRAIWGIFELSDSRHIPSIRLHQWDIHLMGLELLGWKRQNMAWLRISFHTILGCRPRGRHW